MKISFFFKFNQINNFLQLKWIDNTYLKYFDHYIIITNH